jgi:wyosine [tRNA(Phe)-imidazoG37] synthetase (radical SAM superfamily)
MTTKFKYIYGPVASWRLGMSLGIDPISRAEKICNLDCVYCQLGKTDFLTNERKVYVPTAELIREIAGLPPMPLDYLTFSGRGEPTLAKNLGEMIRALRLVRKEKIAVITNSILMDQQEVRDELALADFVLAKLDACTPATLQCISRPLQTARFDAIVSGLIEFRRIFSGRMALQIMFIDANKDAAQELAVIARQIKADEIELNTPLRPAAVSPLSEVTLNKIKVVFQGLPVKTVYEAQRKPVKPLDEQDTVRRHGHYREEGA